MVISVLTLLAGLVLVVLGAEWLVDGASNIARRAGISEFVIGMTIVGFGTSCPELVVSLTGALEGNPDVSVGNVLGSNICNTLLILGLTAVIAPVAVTRKNAGRDIPFTVLVTLLFLCCGLSMSLFGIGGTDNLTRVEGIVLLVLFVAYMIYCFKSDSGASSPSSGESEGGPGEKPRGALAAAVLTLLGLGALVFGGRIFVDSAVEIAREIGVSQKFIAVTILAGGTSLPELATCVVAAARRKDQLALGNILGSNIFNILLILGCSAVVTPLSLAGLDLVDAAVLALSALMVWMWAFTGRRNRIDRWEGALMLALYMGYMVWLFARL